MPLISRNTIEAIKQRANLLEVAGAYTQLKKAGSHWRGLSPFNAERTPSFYVQPEKNVFKCYSSGFAGDLFRFVELKEKLTFAEAVELLADRYAIPLEYEDGGGKAPDRSLRKELLEIHSAAAEFFARAFEKASSVKAYWTDTRRFTLEQAKVWQIGFAPAEPFALTEYLLGKLFSHSALVGSGLFFAPREHESSRQLRTRFRGRLMIPIRDVQGRVVAFSGRQLPETPADDPSHEAKYINSPETDLFVKGDLLFGLYEARQHVEGIAKPFILAEGQLDVLRLWSVGLLGAVAPQGTSVTDAQLHLLRRYATRVLCVMDGDKAGQRAALRVLPMALQAGLELQFIALPQGADPDSLIANEGLCGWEKAAARPLTEMEFAVQALAPQGRKSTPQAKEEAFQTIREFFKDVDSLTLAQTHLMQAAQLLGLYEYVADRAISELRQGRRSSKIHVQKEPPAARATEASLEEQLLVALAHHEAFISPVGRVVDSEWLDKETPEGSLLDRLLAASQEGLWNGFADGSLIAQTQEEKDLLHHAIASKDPFGEEALRGINLLVKALFMRRCEAEKAALSSEMAALDPNDQEGIHCLHDKRIALRAKMQTVPLIIAPFSGGSIP